jgi:hypothetical protein
METDNSSCLIFLLGAYYWILSGFSPNTLPNKNDYPNHQTEYSVYGFVLRCDYNSEL